jgi:hypothetical protein
MANRYLLHVVIGRLDLSTQKSSSGCTAAEQTLQMFHEHQIDVQGRMAVHEAGNLILIKLGDVLRMPARRTAAFCSGKPTVPSSRLLTIRAILSL